MEFTRSCRYWAVAFAAVCTVSVAAAADNTRAARPAQAAAKPPPVAATPAAGQAKTAQGYTVTKPPAWVRMVKPDAVPSTLPAAPVHVVLLDRQTRLPDPKSLAVHWFSRSIRQVNDSSGLEAASRVEFEFDPSTQKLEVHTIALWRGGQRIDKLEPARIKLLQREQQLEQQMLDGRLTASLVIDDLRVGDQLELAYSVIGGNPVFEGKFADTDWSVSSMGPVVLYQYRLLAPAVREVRHQVDPAVVEVVATPPGADGLRETLFRRRGVPAFRYDVLSPTAQYLKEQVQLSEYADWAEVSRWGERLFASAARPGTAVAEAAAKLRDAAPDAASRVRGALDLVQKEVRYFGTEIGPYTHQPASAEQVLAQRFGDCKDKVSLLATLLASLEVPATPVLVSQRYQDGVARMLPSPLAFDHVIAAVELDGKTLLLDATRGLQTGPVAERVAFGYGHGLTLRAGTAALGPLPTSAGVLLSETEDRFTVGDFSQPMALESRQTLYGDLAENLRSARANLPSAELEQAVAAEYLRVYPAARADGPVQIEEVPDRNAVTIVQRLRLEESWRFPEQRRLTADYAYSSLMSVLRLPDQNAGAAARRLSRLGTYRHAIEYRFPDQVWQRPGSNRHDENYRQYALQMRQENGTDRFRIQAELRMLADRVEGSEWNAYREQIVKTWSVLGGAVTVPAMRLSQWDALRSRLAELDSDLRRGRIKVVTPIQADAHAKILIQGEQIASGRLSPKLRAQAMVVRGEQYDHLGEQAKARSDFEQALALDPGNVDAHAALAVNALMRRDDAAAMHHADLAIAQRSANNDSRRIRSYAQYLSGDVGGSRDSLLRLLEDRSEVEAGYGQAWLYLAAKAAGGDGTAALQPYAPQAAEPAWPHPVVKYLKGDIGLDAAIDASRRDGKPDPGRLCELYFFAAEKARLEGEVGKARDWYQRSIQTGVVEFIEHALSTRQLAALR